MGRIETIGLIVFLCWPSHWAWLASPYCQSRAGIEGQPWSQRVKWRYFNSYAPLSLPEHTPALSSPTFRKISNHRQLDPLPTVRLKHQDDPRDETEKPNNEQQRVDPSHLEPNGVIEDRQSCPKKRKQNGLKRVEAEKAVALVWLR